MPTGRTFVILLAALLLAGCNLAANNREAIRQADIAIAQDVYGPSD